MVQALDITVIIMWSFKLQSPWASTRYDFHVRLRPKIGHTIHHITMSRSIPSSLWALRRIQSTTPKVQHHLAPRRLTTQTRLLDRRQPLGTLEELSASRLDDAEISALKKRRNTAAVGVAICMVATIALVGVTDFNKPDKTDAGNQSFPSPEEDEKTRNLRATGTSSVPFFPKTMTLPSSTPQSTATPALPAGVTLPGTSTASNNDEFTLLGLGIRTVSFLSIQVYVVGLYIATADLPVLQSAMIKAGADMPSASTLVSNEKERLKQRLLDPDMGVEVWDKLLQESNIRSLVRVVPTRNTDYAHLRDGWVRGIMARCGNATSSPVTGEKFDDDQFGEAVSEFKKMFGNRNLKKGKVLLLEREKSGRLVGWEQKGVQEDDIKKMGTVNDERVGRLVWMGYLAGKNVSSEGARRDVVDGVMDLVERPIGTVETQVV
jgi:hypothetical protein